MIRLLLRPWNLVLVVAMGGAALAACSSANGDNKPASGGSGGISGSAGAGGLTEGGAASAGAAGQGGDPNNNPTTVVIGPGADASAPGKFGGNTDPSAAPQLVYPDTGILVPPNMNSLEIHFIPGQGQTLFELRFEAPALNFVVYTGCTPLNQGCVFTADQQFWTQLVEASRGKDPVKYRITGVNGGLPGAVGVSDTHTIAFTQEDLTGGLYYWNSAGSIMRYDFGYPLKSAELFLNAAMAGGGVCVGCHVLSRDGTKIAVGRDIPGLSYGVFNVATRAPVTNSNGQPIVGGASFFSFSPDSTQFLFSGGAKIQWMDLTTGAVTNSNLVAGTMPDWSPTGDQMVYSKGTGGPTGVQSASLELLRYDATNKLWNNPQTLVPFTGQNNYYPAFDPSGNWVLFNRSPGNHDSYENIGVGDGGVGDGELWMVNAKTGGAPIRLDNATNPGSCSWPKFAPGLYTYYGGSVVWITFSTARAYGLRLAENAGVQLWMTAIDLNKAQNGQDPSFPAFWLPFQDIKSGNHIAQWVTSVARKPCTTNTDCAGNETCVNGKCVPIIK